MRIRGLSIEIADNGTGTRPGVAATDVKPENAPIIAPDLPKAPEVEPKSAKK